MEIKINSFSILGKEIPIYGIMFIVGFAVAALTAIPKARKMKLPYTGLACSGVFACVGGILGAKLLSILTSISYIIEYKISFLGIIQNGFVFYGGLLGGALGLFLFAKLFRASVLKYFDLFAAGTALGHAIGRIGCLFSGCCYGLPTSGGFYVIYRHAIDPNVPLGVPLLPMQLIECFCLVAIYVICEVVFYRGKRAGVSAVVYALSYATVRFILEFFRGDSVRGVLWGLSTSQYISIAVVVFCLSAMGYILYRSKKKLKSAEDE